MSVLRSSFSILPNSNRFIESYLWKSGFVDWNHLDPVLLEKLGVKYPEWELGIAEAEKAIQEKKIHFFLERLQYIDYWRLFEDFQECFTYVDIETTGLKETDSVTVIGMYSNKTLLQLVKGTREYETFVEDLPADTVFVSYNGKSFDVPVLEAQFQVKLPFPHIDLMNFLHRLGVKGGLKKSEEILGIDRGEFKGMQGYDAVVLWNQYQLTQNQSLLEKLLKYNSLDIENLEVIFAKVYEMFLKKFQLGR